MKRLFIYILIIFLCFFITESLAKGLEEPQFDLGDVIESVEIMPQFPGGDQALFKYLSESVKYPKRAQKEKVEGRVITQFVVNRNGSIIYPRVVWGVSPELDKEALRVILMMPKWSPGEQKGKKVRVKYSLPINFRFQTTKKDTYKREKPEFPGGDDEMMAYFKKNIQCPADVLNGKQKMAFVEFIVNKKGKIKQSAILVTTHVDALDKEALRVIKEMPDWNPGKIDGRATFVRCVLPVYFNP